MNIQVETKMDTRTTRDCGFQAISNPFSAVAPVPISIQQTGLSHQLLKDLVSKHIYEENVTSVRVLCKRLCLAGSVVESVLQLLREETLAELSTTMDSDGTLSFRLTERGRLAARSALDRSGYVGPAPVALSHYLSVTKHFSLANHSVTRDGVKKLFDGFVIEQQLVDQVGAAFNSRKAIFIYGAAGTGKTYTISKMMSLFRDACLVPHAIAVNDSIVQVYDPQVHELANQNVNAKNETNILRYADAFDSRFLLCQRPVVVAGGELTADLLEVRHDPHTRINVAPLQLKANNGIFFIDDIGRQSMPALSIFNRWIVPMEERHDYLTLANGQHFSVPFDVQLVFSSNLNPGWLADDAVLRRIGFKIQFRAITPAAYRQIWLLESEKRQVAFDEALVEYTITQLHQKKNVALLPCHPRDLISIALTQSTFLEEPGRLSEERIAWAWENYFVNFDEPEMTVGLTDDLQRCN